MLQMLWTAKPPLSLCFDMLGAEALAFFGDHRKNEKSHQGQNDYVECER